MSRFFKDRPGNSEPPQRRYMSDNTSNRSPSQAEVRRAKDFYTDVFLDAITAQIDESSAGHASANDIVVFASDIAQRALEEMEKRWPKI